MTGPRIGSLFTGTGAYAKRVLLDRMRSEVAA